MIRNGARVSTFKIPTRRGRAWSQARRTTFMLLLAGAAGCAMRVEAPAVPTQQLASLYDGVPGPINYFDSLVDLNGDGQVEWVVHTAGPAVCGSGGCDTLIFTPDGRGGYRLMTTITVSRPPVIAADSRTSGWRDIAVRVRGGGIVPGYDAILRFDANLDSYPTNPTVAPAERMDESLGREVLIGEFSSFREGKVLKP